MHEIALLSKIYFKQFLGRLVKNKKEGNLTLSIVVLTLIISFFLFMFIGNSNAFIEEAVIYGYDPLDGIYQLLFLSFIFTAFLTILKSTTHKKGNDCDLLLSLPLKKSSIIIAKVFNEITIDLFLTLLSIVPGLVVYKINFNNLSFTIIIAGIIIAILLSLLSASISFILNYILSKVLSHFKARDIIHSVLSAIVTCGFIIVYYWVMGTTTDYTTGFNNKELFNIFFFKEIYSFIMNFDILSFLVVLLVSIIPFIIMVALKANLITKETVINKDGKQNISFKKNNPLKTLLKNDVLRYFKTSVWVVNSILGGMFCIAIGVLCCIPAIKTILFSSLDETILPLFSGNSLAVIVIFDLSMMTSTISINCASISIEGKTSWHLKILPIKYIDILNSKVLMNFLIGFVPVLIGEILTIIGLKLPLIMIPFVLLIPLLNLLGTSIISLSWNVFKYRFDWQSEQEIAKQDMPVLYSMLTCGLFNLISCVIYFLTLTLISPLTFAILLLISMIIYVALLYKLLTTKVLKKFENFNIN